MMGGAYLKLLRGGAPRSGAIQERRRGRRPHPHGYDPPLGFPGTRAGGDVSAELVRKLGIRPGQRLFVREECMDLLAAIKPFLPPRVEVSNQPPRGGAHVILMRPDEEELDTVFREMREWITPDGGVWVVVRKKPYRQEGDVSFEAAQAAALPTGLVDNKECSVNDTEYATRYVLRREHRPRG